MPHIGVKRHLVSGTCKHKLAVDRDRETLKDKVHGGVKQYLKTIRGQQRSCQSTDADTISLLSLKRLIILSLSL